MIAKMLLVRAVRIARTLGVTWRSMKGPPLKTPLERLVLNPTLQVQVLAEWRQTNGAIARLARDPSLEGFDGVLACVLAELAELARISDPEERNRKLRRLDQGVLGMLEMADLVVPEDVAWPSPELRVPASSVRAMASAADPVMVARVASDEARPAWAELAHETIASLVPREGRILWVEDTLTGAVFPATVSTAAADAALGLGADAAQVANLPAAIKDELVSVGVLASSADHARRCEALDAQLAAARASLAQDEYAVLRGVLPEAFVRGMDAYLEYRFTHGLAQYGDLQSGRRDVIYGDKVMASAHPALAALLNRIVDEPIDASYCYTARYHDGARLPRHRDRPQCKWNMSFVVRAKSDEPQRVWPIFVEAGGQARKIELHANDAVVYSGTDLWHWRDEQPAGLETTACFYHFVPRTFTGGRA